MDFSSIHFHFHVHRALQLPLASRDVDDEVLKLKQLGIAAAAKSDIFAEEDIVMSMEAEELTARYFPLCFPYNEVLT
jgi:hypothetical protein